MNNDLENLHTKKRIVIAATSAADGGAERVAVLLANYFYEKGFDVTFVAVLNDKITYPLNPGVRYVFCGYNKGNKYLYAFHRSKELKDIVKKASPCVLISFVILENIFIPFLRNVYKIYSVRNDPSREFSGGIWFHIRNYIYERANSIVFQTEEERQFFNSKIQDKGVIIGNPVSESLPCWDIDGHEKTILAAGRLSQQKNFKMLINAFNIFVQDHSDYKLMIYGEGNLRNTLTEQIESLGLQNSVILAGFTENIHEKMEHAAIYVSSSDYEGISNSMLEALAIGVPSICTDCPAGGARQYIEDGINGMLTEVGNADMLAEKMTLLTDDESLQVMMSSNARQIRDKLSINNICSQWYKIFE